MATLRFLLVVGLLATAGASSARAQDEEREWIFRLALGRMEQGLEGDFTFGPPGPANSPLDVDSLLDIGDSKEFAGWLEFQPFRNHRVSFGYAPVDFGGTNLLPVTTIVLGIPFLAGDTVSSRFEFDRFDVAYRYDFRPASWLRISPGLQLSVFDGSFEVQDLTLAVGTGDDLTAPVPLPQLSLELIPHERLRIFADARGFRASSWGEVDNAKMWEGEAGVAIRLARHVELLGTLRLSDLDFDVDDTRIDLSSKGFFLGLDLVY